MPGLPSSAIRPLPAVPVGGDALPLTLIVPAMVTAPVARMTTGVFAPFFWKVIVTPTGMLTVV
jgi:hypothetical protein